MNEPRKLTLLELEPNFGDRLAKAISVAGYTYIEVADILRVNRNSISNWTNCRSFPRARDLDAVADLCGVSVQWLLEGFDDNMPTGFEDDEASGHLVRPLGLEPRTHWFRVSVPDTAHDFLSQCARYANEWAKVNTLEQ